MPAPIDMETKATHQPTDALTRSSLVDFFSTAERPDQSTHLIGTELEKFGVVAADEGRPLLPVSYEGHVLPILDALTQAHGWVPGPDRGVAGQIIELTRDGASITLEPGGQLELSGAPLPNLHATCAEFTQHYRELHSVSQPLGLTWFASGFHPWATRDEINWMPKGRYAVMRQYLPTRGQRALDMMLRTCTVQANFDFASEAQCGERLKVANGLAPIFLAVFANSPFYEGRRTGLQSNRGMVWTEVDPDRSGTPPFVYDEPFSYERYVDWALDVPTFFVKRDGIYHPHHVPFRTFLEQGYTAPDGVHHRAQWKDWILHLSTVFPEVRLKPFIELRSADAVGSRFVCALPALAKGILYDDAALREAWSLVDRFSFAEREDLRLRACTKGVHDPEIHRIAKRMIEIARVSLDRMDVRDSQGRTEARFLDRIQEVVERGESPGDQATAGLGDDVGRTPEAQHAFVKAFHFAGVFG